MTLVPVAKWNLSQTVSGLGASSDGERLYVTLPGEVEALAATTGRALWSMRVPGVEGIHSVAAATS